MEGKSNSGAPQIEWWAETLGLLPVPLVESAAGKYVMLNGTRGNFCLDLGTVTPAAGPDTAWSVNVGHFVAVQKHFLEVQRWDRPDSVERYSLESVLSNIERFHKYLEESEPLSDLSVVSHVVRVFRRLRSTLPAEKDEYSLSAFLYLLASSSDQQVNGAAFSKAEWELPPSTEEAAKAIRIEDWEALRRELLEGRIHQKLKLHLPLMLRHAAGPIFQEAHYEAVISNPSQLRLAGFAPEPAKIIPRTQASGIHFTPPPLARALVEQSLSVVELAGRTSLTIFDPACGSGEFLREALRQLRLRGFHGHVYLVGRDYSSLAVEMAKFLLNWEKVNDPFGVTVIVSHGDSLAENYVWPTETDVLLMNPPFVSYEKMTDDQLASTMRILGDLVHGRVDLSIAFLWRAVQSVGNKAVLGVVIPASFLELQASLKVRSKMNGIVRMLLIARLGSHSLFPNAIVDAAMFVATPAQSTVHDHDCLAFWADHRPSSNSRGLRELRKLSQDSLRSSLPSLGDGFAIYYAPGLTKQQNWSPRPYKSWRLLQELSSLPRVQDLFDVKSGARSGRKGAFLIDKKTLLALPRGEQLYFRPAVLNESLRSGFLQDARYIFYPYGRYCLEDESEFRKKLPVFYQRFKKHKPALLTRLSKKHVNKWWEMSESRTWQHNPGPKLVSVEYGDAGSFGWDGTGRFVVVGGYAWLPKQVLKGAAKNISRDIAFAYLAVLNSPVMSELLAATCRRVQGGQWDLSKKYVNNIALPNFAEAAGSSLVKGLSDFGEKIYLGQTVDSDTLEKIVRQAYDVLATGFTA